MKTTATWNARATQIDRHFTSDKGFDIHILFVYEYECICCCWQRVDNVIFCCNQTQHTNTIDVVPHNRLFMNMRAMQTDYYYTSQFILQCSTCIDRVDTINNKLWLISCYVFSVVVCTTFCLDRCLVIRCLVGKEMRCNVKIEGRFVRITKPVQIDIRVHE